MRNLHLIPTENGKHIYITSDEKPKAGDWSVYQNDKIHKCMEDIVGDTFKKIILTTDQDLIADGVQSIDDTFLEWFVKNPSCEFVEVEKECIYQGKCKKERCLNHPCNEKQYKIIIPQEEEFKHPPVFSENGNQLFFDNQGKLIKEETKHIPYTGKVWEPPVSETLEEASKRAVNSGLFKDETLFIAGVKWQQERMYSEEEVKKIVRDAYTFGEKEFKHFGAFKEWFEQFKKK